MFFEFFKEKSSTFNTGFVSYNVSLQPNIRKKILRKHARDPKIISKWSLNFFHIFVKILKVFLA